MRVLVLATTYFGVGGAEGYTRMFTEAAAAEGATVDVLSLLDGETIDRTCPGRYLGDGGRRSTPWAKARFVGEALRRGAGYDRVICGHVALAPIGHLIYRFTRVPYIVIGHGIDVWEGLPTRKREALRRAERVVAVSHFTAGMITTVQGVPSDRVTVIHPAVDPVLLSQALVHTPAPRKEDAVTLLTVARLSAKERYKGCDTVIAALPDVQAKAGPIRYVIVGDGDDRARLEELAKKHGVAATTTFVGLVNRSGLAAYYRGCDIFVMPSIVEQSPSGWTGEGFGIVYIEAAAFGRPVIAGVGGGAPEAVRDGVTGYLVNGQDVGAVAGALTQLSVDEALRARMGAAGRDWVKDSFTVERFRRDVGTAIAVGTRAKPRGSYAERTM